MFLHKDILISRGIISLYLIIRHMAKIGPYSLFYNCNHKKMRYEPKRLTCITIIHITAIAMLP